MSFPTHRRGSILILALWMLSFLAMVAVSLGAGVRARLALVDRLEQRRILSWLGKGGIAQLVEDLKASSARGPRDRLLEPEEIVLGVPSAPGGPGRRAVIARGISNVESKINVNLATAEQLTRLFVAIGRSESEAEDMAGAVVDWRDADSDASGPHGAESPYYEGLGTPYACKNAPLERLDELLLVRGFNAKILADLEYLLTVYGDGPVLPDLASAPVLYALGLTRDFSERIVLYRDGEDMKPGTEDDVFKMDSFFPAQENPAVVRLRERVAVSKEEAEALTAALTDGRLGFNTRFFELTSVASLAGKRGRFRVHAVVELSPQPDETGATAVQLRSWTTSFDLG